MGKGDTQSQKTHKSKTSQASKHSVKSIFAKVWHFLWKDDSAWSWIANIVVAFIVIKFLIYPVLGLIFATNLPIVAVVSGSMEHRGAYPCESGGFRIADGACLRPDTTRFDICGQNVEDSRKLSLDEYWDTCGYWYENNTQIRLQDFESFRFSNGFNIGDVMIIYGKDWHLVEVGETLLFMGDSGMPIIHRVVSITESDSGYRTVMTKGDHNQGPNPLGPNAELAITEDQYKGVAVARIPWIGYVKIYFVRGILGFIGLFS